MDLPISFLASLAQCFQEDLPVAVGGKDRLAVVFAIHDVVDGARILDSEFASHVRQDRSSNAELTILRTDPRSERLG
jgi:hypothetical protein